MTVSYTMLQRTKKTSRQWLTLLFIAGFLLNIQASYACAMMPDMEQKQTDCCCGASHRMDEMFDSMQMVGMNMDHVDQVDAIQTDQLANCNDPHTACCTIESSVGINDPPDDGSYGIATYSNTVTYKFCHTIDAGLPNTAFYALENTDELRAIAFSIKPPDPYLHHYSSPLFKTTERYRI